MTNDKIREMLSMKGVSVGNVTDAQLVSLHGFLSESLASSDCFRGTFRMDPLGAGEDAKYMTCSADYFEGREAISFNRDGFIGMAGWASESNVEPIRKAVVAWADSF